MKAEYIAKIRETAEYIIENPCEYSRDTSEYENAEFDFFWHGACEIFVGFDDRLIRLVPNTMKEDAEFVLNNLEKITYFYIVNEDYDSVVGDICAYLRKFNFNRDCVASYEYTQAIIDLMGNITIEALNNYFNNKYHTYIFNVLYNEIVTIKNAIADNENYSFTKLYEADGLEYLVILNDHRVFYISVGTNVLPEFDKNNVLYIRKKIGGTEFIDTEIGYFQTDDQLSHGYAMEEKFDAAEDFDTHCYN